MLPLLVGSYGPRYSRLGRPYSFTQDQSGYVGKFPVTTAEASSSRSIRGFFQWFSKHVIRPLFIGRIRTSNKLVRCYAHQVDYFLHSLIKHDTSAKDLQSQLIYLEQHSQIAGIRSRHNKKISYDQLLSKRIVATCKKLNAQQLSTLSNKFSKIDRKDWHVSQQQQFCTMTQTIAEYIMHQSCREGASIAYDTTKQAAKQILMLGRLGHIVNDQLLQTAAQHIVQWNDQGKTIDNETIKMAATLLLSLHNRGIFSEEATPQKAYQLLISADNGTLNIDSSTHDLTAYDTNDETHLQKTLDKPSLFRSNIFKAFTDDNRMYDYVFTIKGQKQENDQILTDQSKKDNFLTFCKIANITNPIMQKRLSAILGPLNALQPLVKYQQDYNQFNAYGPKGDARVTCTVTYDSSNQQISIKTRHTHHYTEVTLIDVITENGHKYPVPISDALPLKAGGEMSLENVLMFSLDTGETSIQSMTIAGKNLQLDIEAFRKKTPN